MVEKRNTIYTHLEQRLGSSLLKKRIQIQVEHSEDVYGRIGLSLFHPENADFLMHVLGLLLKYTGTADYAAKNTLDFRIEKQDIIMQQLQESLHGFTILQLSDLHIECFVDEGRALSKLIEGLSNDLCVITGDFRSLSHGDSSRCIELIERLASAISCPHGIVGVPGNHDFIEMVPDLEKAGIRMLVNESMRIGSGEGSLFLAGVDDPHFYGTSDMEKALEGASGDDVVVLLVHSPELYRKAHTMGVDYYICGHTHGGQICMPGGIPVITNNHTYRKYVQGAWNYHGMRGYTSRGTGSAGQPARFFCPPEVTLHRFLRG